MPNGLGKWKEWKFLPEELEEWVSRFGDYPQHLWEYTLKRFVGEGRLSETQALQLGRELLQRRQTRGWLAEQAYMAQRPPAEREAPRYPARPKAPEIEPLAPAERLYYPFIKGLPTPAMQEYFRYQFPAVYREFGGAEAMARAEEGRLEAAIQAESRVRGRKRARTREEKRYKAARVSPIPTAGRAALARAGTTIGLEKARGQVRGAVARRKALREPEHPFGAYLKKYPFVEEFKRLTPAQRGYFPSRFRPQTRWLGF